MRQVNCFIRRICQAVVVCTFKPSAGEIETDRSLSSRPVWLTEQVPRLPGLHRGTLSKKKRRVWRGWEGEEEEVRRGKKKRKII